MRIPSAVFSVKNNGVPRATPPRETSSKANSHLSAQHASTKHSSFRDLNTHSSVARFSTKPRPDPRLLDFINAKNEVERIEALNRLMRDDSQSDHRFFKPAKYEYDAAIKQLNSDVLNKVKQNNVSDISSEDLVYKPKR